MDLRRLALTPGGRAGAYGHVLARDGLVSIDPPMARTQPLHTPGYEPSPHATSLAVTVTGVDTDALAHRREQGVPGGWVRGTAYLEGTWAGDRLAVTDQRPNPPPGPARPPRGHWIDPPCPPPPGGWPLGGELVWPEALEDDAIRTDATAVQTTVFRPAGAGPVWVVAAEDVDAAEAVLRPVMGPRLCVVASRYTHAQVDDAHQDAQARYDDWLAFEAGRSSAPDGQARLTLRVVRVTDDLTEWAAGLPDGLLDVDAWMVPPPPPTPDPERMGRRFGAPRSS